MRAQLRSKLGDASLVCVGLVLALALRVSLLEFKSIDYLNYTKVWYNALKTGGFSAFGQGFSNYNLPYLYLLYLVIRFLPDLPALVATKLPSILADLLCAWFAYRIVRLGHEESPLPYFAALSCLFAPTVVLNSAFWGQADAVYVSALIVCIYYLLHRHGALSMLFFGVSLAFKSQAIFLLPLLLALVLRRELSWKHLFLVPLAPILALIPAWFAGRSPLELLLIYPAQAAQYEQLTMHAPSALSWVPDSGRFYPYFYPAGIIITTAAALGFILAVSRSQTKLSATLLVELSLISVMLMPFLLPKMHERYFFSADVLSIVLAFFIPRYFFVPLTMITISFFAYQPTLFGVEPVPIDLLALGVLALLIILIRDGLLQLFPGTHASEGPTAAVQYKV